MQISYPNVGVKSRIESIGKPATIVRWSKKLDVSGDPVRDEYNNFVWEEDRDEITAARAMQTNTKVSVKMNSDLGQYQGFDFEFFTTDDVSYLEELPPVGKKPEIIFQGRRHRIHNVEVMPIGVSRLITEQMRTSVT